MANPAVLSRTDQKQPSTAADRRYQNTHFLLLRPWRDQYGLILVSPAGRLMMNSPVAAPSLDEMASRV